MNDKLRLWLYCTDAESKQRVAALAKRANFVVHKIEPSSTDLEELIEAATPDVLFSDVTSYNRAGQELLSYVADRVPTARRIGLAGHNLRSQAAVAKLIQSTNLSSIVYKENLEPEGNLELTRVIRDNALREETTPPFEVWHHALTQTREAKVFKFGGSILDIVKTGRNSRGKKVDKRGFQQYLVNFMDGVRDQYENGGAVVFVGGGPMGDLSKQYREDVLETAVSLSGHFDSGVGYFQQVQEQFGQIDPRVFQVNLRLVGELLERHGIPVDYDTELGTEKYGGVSVVDPRQSLGKCVKVVGWLEPFASNVPKDRSDQHPIRIANAYQCPVIYFKDTDGIFEMDPHFQFEEDFTGDVPKRIQTVSAEGALKVRRVGIDRRPGHLVEDDGLYAMLSMQNLELYIRGPFDAWNHKNVHGPDISRIVGGKTAKMIYAQNSKPDTTLDYRPPTR